MKKKKSKTKIVSCGVWRASAVHATHFAKELCVNRLAALAGASRIARLHQQVFLNVVKQIMVKVLCFRELEKVFASLARATREQIDKSESISKERQTDKQINRKRERKRH